MMATVKQSALLIEVEKYCTNLLREHCAKFPFHDLTHTREVVNNVGVIGAGMNLDSETLEPVRIAAWFHDTGFREAYAGHETVSIRIATEFLRARNYPEDKLKQVTTCIEATRMPQQPANALAEILADADIFHISNENFYYRKLLLRREWEMVLGKQYNDQEWHSLNLKFLLAHRFFTSYGKQVLMECQHMNESKVRKVLSFYS